MITVLTPTFNRADKIKNLFQSLLDQECNDFIWLIIDDGSVDNTDAVIENCKHKANFKIVYKKKVNGGKHTALNYAYQYIDTKLTFIVDSDDELTKDAISTIEKVDNKFGDESDLCGYSFLRKKRNGGYLSSGVLPQNGYKADFVTCRINGDLSGDMAEVWKTECLKKFPFPEFAGEKFLGEDIVWIQMANEYKMRFFSKAIYISDYLEDGLTNNRRKNNIKSPKGCIARAEVFLNSNANYKYKIKAMLQYTIYGKFAGYGFKDLYQNCTNKANYLFFYLPAEIIYQVWRKKYSGS